MNAQTAQYAVHEIGELSTTAFVLFSALKALGVFSTVMLLIVLMTWAERRVSAWIQDRNGPNRVGPFGLLQPIADGLKNITKEEVSPNQAARLFYYLAPAMAIMPALVTFAVIPYAAPLPTRWGVVDMIVADPPIGILYILALSSLGVYGIFMAGWSSNNKYAFLGGLRASAQMVSYEVALGMSLVPVFMLAGNVTLTQIVWTQQEPLGLWLAFPLGLSFLIFTTAAFAETNRLPFDMPEAESELVAGYHTEYSAMKFSMFPIAEYGNMITAAALMATLFFGGWDVPFASFDDMRSAGGGLVLGAEPAWWKTLVTFGFFGVKVAFFLLLYIWVRWTLPRFRYDQIMHLGWKVLIPSALAFILLTGTTILLLDELGLDFGLVYGLIITAVNTLALLGFLFWIDRDRVIGGSAPALRTLPRARPVRPARATAGVE